MLVFLYDHWCEVRVEESSEFSSKSVSYRDRISVKPEFEPTIFSHNSFFGHSVVVLCLDQRKVSPGCENFLHWEECAQILLRRVAPTRVEAY